ncbi:MAG: tRNA dihydrouridine synthase DusB [Gammaproteobacteria bacterium]|nr:MAG: tRNA dihydrouridine synthase DusB [Gammaproteobacteria bacterium]
MKIGHYNLDNNLFLAPMAGVTDLPFRRLCKRLGAGVVVSEMVTSDPSLWLSRKTQLRLAQDVSKEPGLKVVQIAGGDAEILAKAARLNADNGAQVIDINMGCPAKKVCKKAAGSALLKNPKLVEQILNAVVAAVDIPVTLKIRTGWDKENKNALQIARMAEDAGIQSLAIHGRTRECKYKGLAEHDTVALVKQSISIPVIANGDINTPLEAKRLLDYTKVDGLMIGRAAQGRPWIFREIDYFLKNNQYLPPIETKEIKSILLEHVEGLHLFYGELQGLRIARKHVGWYLANDSAKNIEEYNIDNFKKRFNHINTAQEQLQSLNDYFEC